MIDLTPRLGFELHFDPQTHSFQAGPDAVLGDRRDVLFDELSRELLNAESDGPDLIARVYSQVYAKKDETALKEYRVRFELKILNQGMLGPEPLKTAGHYHNLIPGTSVSYPKIFEVLHGKCHFLLQKANPPYETVTDAVLIIAEEGERIVVPPGYGHTEINPTQSPVVLASWFAKDAKAIEEPYIQRKGACYYATRAEKTLLFVPNEAYPDIPALRVGRAHELLDFAVTGQPFYRGMIENTQRLKRLTLANFFPEEFQGIFKFAQEMHGLLL